MFKGLERLRSRSSHPVWLNRKTWLEAMACGAHLLGFRRATEGVTVTLAALQANLLLQ